MTILIADDSSVVRERVKRLLSTIPGVDTVCEADDGGAALEMMREHPIDISILDLRMPKLDGNQVVQECRRRGIRSILLMLTNYAGPESRRESLDAGADFFFDKSSEYEIMLETVRKLAEKLPIRPSEGTSA